MLPMIIKNSVLLVKFIAVLGLTLKPAPLQHLTNVADALIVASERRKKSLSALNRCLLEPPTDEYALADCFRASPWHAEDVRTQVLQFLVPYAFALAEKLKLDKIIFISLDDSLCEKDPGTKHLQAVDWHHDHNARAKKQASYKNGSVYVLCRIQIGFIAFTVNWRLYLREQTVKQLNKGRVKADRLVFQSKLDLAQAMLTDLRPYLPETWTVYVLFDSWYASKDLIRFIRHQGWQAIGGLKANRTLNGKQLKQWFAEQRPTPAKRLTVPVADEQRRSYWVYVLTGRLTGLPVNVCVLISRRHPGDKHPAYFFTTDLSLAPTQVLEKYGHRWGCEVDNFDLKVLLGLADYQLQKLAGILRWHAAVFLALAYLQWRRVRLLASARDGPVQTVPDVIALHRHEHLTAFIKAIAEATLQTGAVRPVLKRFLRPRPARAAT
jgi:hypothetical protein